MAHRFSSTRPVWQFTTRNFEVVLLVHRDYDYQYDGDDEDGSYQAQLDSGELVAFDSHVVVYFRGEEVARDSLHGSTYLADGVADFWTAHRGPDPMDRNCTTMRAAHGQNVAICHYFPSMVAEAIQAARAEVRTRQVYLRDGAK